MNLKNDKLFPRFSAYGFLKNLRFFDPFIILIFREAGLSFLDIGGASEIEISAQIKSPFKRTSHLRL